MYSRLNGVTADVGANSSDPEGEISGGSNLSDHTQHFLHMIVASITACRSNQDFYFVIETGLEHMRQISYVAFSSAGHLIHAEFVRPTISRTAIDNDGGGLVAFDAEPEVVAAKAITENGVGSKDVELGEAYTAHGQMCQCLRELVLHRVARCHTRS